MIIKLKPAEQFMILTDMVRILFPVKVKIVDIDSKHKYDRLAEFPNGKLRPNGGAFIFAEPQHIRINILPKMSSTDWRYATSALIHEVGHLIAFSENEKKAWKKGMEWISKTPYLIPKGLDKIKEESLETYSSGDYFN